MYLVTFHHTVHVIAVLKHVDCLHDNNLLMKSMWYQPEPTRIRTREFWTVCVLSFTCQTRLRAEGHTQSVDIKHNDAGIKHNVSLNNDWQVQMFLLTRFCCLMQKQSSLLLLLLLHTSPPAVQRLLLLSSAAARLN